MDILQEETLTPAMQQYFALKEQFSDCILFFRMGDFYEMFWEDAQIANRVLWITLTTRNKNAKEPIPLAGIPYHAKDKYLPKLIEAGYKIALSEQVSDPKLKGIVKREVVRVITPSTLSLEWENYEQIETNTYIISIVEENGIFSISTLNIADNDWRVYKVKSFDELSQILYKIYPQEVILERGYTLSTQLEKVLKGKLNTVFFFHTPSKKYKENLLHHFWTKNLIAFWIEEEELCQKSANLLLEYLQSNQKENMNFLNSLSFESLQNSMQLDESTLRSLDIFYNFSTKSEVQGTLFWILSETKTSGGKRVLKKNLLEPLITKKDIENRLNIVEELKNNPILLSLIREKLRSVSDIDSILNRISLNRTTPRDLLALKMSLESIVEIQKILQEKGSEQIKKIIEE